MSASWPALLPVLPVLGLLRWLGLGGQHLHSQAYPKQRIQEHRLAWVSKLHTFLFLKLSYVGQLTLIQWTSPAQTWAGRWWLSTWLRWSEVVPAECLAWGVSPLCSGERMTLLPASEWGFYVTQQDLPSNGPFLFKLTASHTEDQWQFVFAATILTSLEIVLRD